ncbi:MAG: hypothetical protein AAF203_09400 [Pseudomonadota bacterium]
MDILINFVYTDWVKYLVVLIILMSFLPLQSGLGCNMPMENADNEMPCHQEMATSQNASSTSQSHNPRQLDHHSECSFCQSGFCQNVALIQDSLLLGNHRELADLQCEVNQRFILPMDLFLLPIKERAPPPGKRNIPILSYDWQAFYSIFLI